MLKFRTNLRIVATIVACFAVTTMFASCDKDNGDGDGGNGNPATTAEDVVSVKALAGLWHTKGYIENYYWSFNDKGQFVYYISGKQVAQGITRA